jgi:hypothetical protein
MRGFSLLSAILVIALAGGMVVSVKLLSPNISSLSQSAAAAPAASGQSATSQTYVSDIPPKQITVSGKSYWVYYECSLFTTTASDPSAFKLNCQPGFTYTLIETNGTFRVDVAVDSSVQQCSAGLPDAGPVCAHGVSPVASCPADPSVTGTIHYKLSAKSLSGRTLSDLQDATQKSFQLKCTQGQKLDFAKIRDAGANAYLNAAPDAAVKSDVSQALAQYALPLNNNTVDSAYDPNAGSGQGSNTNTQAQIAQIEQQRANIQTQLQSYANCGDSSCAYAQQMLQQQDAALAVQEQALKDQQASLSGSNQDASAGAPAPGTSAPTLPQGQTFTGTGDQNASAGSDHVIASDQGNSPASSLPTATGDWATANTDPSLQTALDTAAARQRAQLTLEAQAKAFGDRMAYMNNNPTMQKIYDAVVASGRTPAEASAYTNDVVNAEAPLGATQAEMDSYLQGTYNRMVQYGSTLNAEQLAALSKNSAPDYAGYTAGSDSTGAYGSYTTDAQGNVVYNPNGNTNVAQGNSNGNSSGATANANQDVCSMGVFCIPEKTFNWVSQTTAPLMNKLNELAGNSLTNDQSGNSTVASAGTETGVPWDSLNLTPSASAAEMPGSVGSQTGAPDYANYAGSSNGSPGGAYSYYSTDAHGNVTYNTDGTNLAQSFAGGNPPVTAQSPSYYGDTNGAGYNALPDTSSLPPVPVTGVTSEPIGPATPPSGFQKMLSLPSNATIQQQLAALGDKTTRADLVSNYLSNDPALQNYTGTYAQNVALVQAVQQYGATPPASTPAPDQTVPTPSPAPIYVQPQVPAVQTQVIAQFQSLNGGNTSGVTVQQMISGIPYSVRQQYVSSVLGGAVPGTTGTYHGTAAQNAALLKYLQVQSVSQ